MQIKAFIYKQVKIYFYEIPQLTRIDADQGIQEWHFDTISAKSLSDLTYSIPQLTRIDASQGV